MNSKNEHPFFYWFGWQGLGLFCWFMWGMSSFMSYWGLVSLDPNIPWWMKITAIGMAIGINFVEFMLNRMTMDELFTINDVSDLVLRLFGIVSYLYDVFTNVVAFLAVVHLVSNTPDHMLRIGLNVFAVFFGILFAIGPEPTYIKYLKERTPFPGFGHYTPKYKGAYVSKPSGVSPAVEEYLKRKVAEQHNAQR